MRSRRIFMIVRVLPMVTSSRRFRTSSGSRGAVVLVCVVAVKAQTVSIG